MAALAACLVPEPEEPVSPIEITNSGTSVTVSDSPHAVIHVQFPSFKRSRGRFRSPEVDYYAQCYQRVPSSLWRPYGLHHEWGFSLQGERCMAVWSFRSNPAVQMLPLKVVPIFPDGDRASQFGVTLKPLDRGVAAAIIGFAEPVDLRLRRGHIVLEVEDSTTPLPSNIVPGEE